MTVNKLFYKKNIEAFTQLYSLNEKSSYLYIETNTPDKDNDEEKQNNESHFLSNMNEDDTLVYILIMEDAQRGIHNYVPPGRFNMYRIMIENNYQ